MTEDEHTIKRLHPALDELVTQDPRCYYRMVDAVIRRHGHDASVGALDAIRCFKHPADVVGLAGPSSQQLGTDDPSSIDICNTRDQGGSVNCQCTDQFYLSVAMSVSAVAAFRDGSSSCQCKDLHQPGGAV